MARIFIQQKSTATTANSIAVTLPNPTTTGNFLFAAITTANGTVSSISDSQTNTYSNSIAVYNYTGTHRLTLYFAENITGGTNTITANLSAVQITSMVVREYQGVKKSGSYQTDGRNSASTTAVSSGAITPTTANQLNIAVATGASSNVFTRGDEWKNFLMEISATTDGIGIEESVGFTNVTGKFTSNLGLVWGCIVATFLLDVGNAITINNLRPRAFSPGIAR